MTENLDGWEAEDLKEISKLQKRGHSYHCACRQVWGDGECECVMYAKGYDPYAWTKYNQSLEPTTTTEPPQDTE